MAERRTPPKKKQTTAKRTVKKRTPRKKATRDRPGETRDKPGRPPIIEKGWNDLDRTWHHDSPCGRFISAIRIGSYIKVACRLADISYPTWKNWSARAREHHVNEYDEPDWDSIPESEIPYVAFLAAVERAEAESEVELIGRIRKAGQKEWRANLALLSRRHPERWRERSGVDVEMSGQVEMRRDEALKILEDEKVQGGVAAAEAALAALTTGDDVDG